MARLHYRRDAVDITYVGEPQEVDVWRIRRHRRLTTRRGSRMVGLSVIAPSRRDISVVIGREEDEETVGVRIRTAIGDNAHVVESVEMLGRNTHEELRQRPALGSASSRSG